MGTTIGHKDVATKGSGHTAVAPPETSLNPPTPPAGPVPGPWPCLAKTSSAASTSSALKVAGDEVVTDASVLDVERPGNQVSQPTGGDVMTHAVVGKAPVTSGSGATTADGKGVACTGDSVAINTMTAQAEMSQAKGVLLKAGGADVSSAGGSADEEEAKKKRAAALLARQAEKAGEASAPPAKQCPAEGDPIDVVSGAVVDRDVDLRVPGVFELVWERFYSSARAGERGALGRGGWRHGLEQWLEEKAETIVLRTEDGRSVYFARVEPGASTFHRRERLTLSRDRAGTGFELQSAETQLTRTFQRTAPGERAPLVRIADRYGNRIELRYAAGLLDRVTDTAGRELRVLADEHGRVARLELWAATPPPAPPPLGVVEAPRPPVAPTLQWACVYAYSEASELASVTDACGHTERYAYDGLHRLATKTLKNGTRFTYVYDPDTGRCVHGWGDARIHNVELTFDLEAGTTMSSGHDEPRLYTWNAAGFVVAEETLDGDFARRRELDEDMFLLRESNAAGEALECMYDARGNRVFAKDPAGNATYWRYRGDLVVERIDPSGLETTFERDDRGTLIGITYPNGTMLTRTVDGQGRLTGVQGRDGRLVEYVYDEHHNVARSIDARGSVTRYTYDALGRVTSRTDALGRTERVEYDPMGRPTALLHEGGSIERFEHDALGKVVVYVDEAGLVTRLGYAGTGALVEVARPGGRDYELRYDRLERLREIKNPRGERYEMRYDSVGRVVFERYFDGQAVEYTYSRAERIARIDYADRTWRNLSYDPLGNLVEDQSPHGTITIERDSTGLATRAVVDEHGGKVVTRIERDELGQVIAETHDGRTVRYEYDGLGRRAARILPDGTTTRYAHDLDDALSGVDHDGHKLSFVRDALGREIRTHVERAGVDIVSAYDGRDRLVERQVATSSPTAATHTHAQSSRRAWRYDLAGRVAAVDDSRWGVTTYGYDEADDLTEVRGGRHHEVFEYDVNGALEAVLRDGATGARSPYWSLKKGGIVTHAEGAEYHGDARGRRVKKREKAPDGEAIETEYTWDCRDRLREVRPPSGDRVLFTYDGFGRRVRKQVVPAARRDGAAMVELALVQGKEALPKIRVVDYLWDGDVLAAEIDSERGTRVFVHRPGTFEPLLQQEQGETFTYVNDALGAPLELLDGAGKTAWAGYRSGWGTEVETWTGPSARERPVVSPFRVLGQYHDEETDLCHTRYRYFDPQVARWLSPDPLGIHGGANLYGWNGTPTNAVDPLGLACTNPGPDADIAAKARSFQGQGDYPGTDSWSNTIIKKGTILCMGEPGTAGFFTTPGAVDSVGNSRSALFQGLQVAPNPTHGYRPRVGIYVVTVDTPAATANTSANPQHGGGGLPQVYMPHFAGVTTRTGEIPLGT